MSRSQREERGGGYASARDRAEKAGSGSRAGYIKLPSGVKLFKPKAGIVLLDIMPFRAGVNNPFADEGMKYYERTFFVHRNIGPNEEMMLCPRKTSGGRCPICERKAVLARKDDDDSEALAKELEPRQRQLFNLINRKEPDAGIQIWDISYHLFGEELDKSIRASDEDDRWDAFFHLKDGFTLKVSMEDDSFSGHAFVRAGRIDFKKREPYESDMLEQSHCLDELLIELPYDKLKKLYLGVDDDESEEEPRHRREQEDDEAPRSKKRHAEEEDDRGREQEEDEAPKRKRPVDEDEDKPKKKPAAEDDDWDDFDEDKPKKKPAAEEEEEPRGKKRHTEDEEEPKHKRPAAEEEEETPRRKRPVDEDEDKPKKKSDDDDEWDKFDEDKPKKKPAAEEDEPAPKRKRPAAEEEDEPAPKRRR